MGEVGTALADDMGMTFYNPAGIGIDNKDFRYGYGATFFEPLLPIFQLDGLWHSAFVGQVQLKSKLGLVGGFGIFYNFLSFGEHIKTDEKGRVLNKFTSYEQVLGLNAGIGLVERKEFEMALGLNFKYAKSALDRTIAGGVAKTYAFDVGYLLKTKPGIKIGVNFMNMGPPVYYTSKDDADPIPFTIRLGFGYDREFTLDGMKFIRVKAGYDLEREFVYNVDGEDPEPFFKAIFKSVGDQPAQDEWDEVIHHIGVEGTFYNTGMIRFGLLKDDAGSRREFNFGFGANLFNSIEANYSIIISPNGSEARHGQWRIDFVFKKIGNWKESDRKWYLVDESDK